MQGSKGSEVGGHTTLWADHTFPMTLTQRLVWRFTTGGRGGGGLLGTEQEAGTFTFDPHHRGVDDKVSTVVKHWV